MDDNIKTIIISAIVSATISLLSALFSYIADKRKIIYTEKSKIVSDLIKEKYKGIEEIRIVVKKLSRYEDLCMTEPDDVIIKEYKDKKVIIPEIFYSYESLYNFISELNECIGNYGHCIEPKVIVFLIKLRNILTDYLILCQKLKVSDELIRWSAIPFYDEVRECDKQLEKYVIQTMNKTNSKYYARSGFFYELYMKKYQRFFERTNLYKTIYSDNSLLKVIISKQDEIDRVVSEAAGEEKEEVLKKYYEENLAKLPIDLNK